MPRRVARSHGDPGPAPGCEELVIGLGGGGYGLLVAYRLDLAAGAPTALRAAAAEQLDDAIRQLTDEPDAVRATHETRKDLKKVRSLLRLAAPGMPAKQRRDSNARLRAIAAQLAGARDADVMVQTVDRLRVRFAGQVPARAFTTARRRFAAQAQATEVPAGVVDALRDELAALADWQVDGVDRPALAGGVALAYARGRAGFRAAREEPTVDGLHEWRKRVKDLWYHAKLLEESWPRMWVAVGDEAHALSDLLGDDHDLGVLAERFGAQTWPASVDADTFIRFCHQLRGELQAEAFALGARLYAEKPKAFARRTGAYLRA